MVGSRPPAVAGTFYPDDPDELASVVDRALATAPTGANAAALQPSLDAEGEEIAFVTRATNLFASHSPAVVSGPASRPTAFTAPRAWATCG